MATRKPGKPVRPSKPGARRPTAAVPAIRWGDNSPVNSDDARGRILAAAVECVRRFGVDKTGMDEVARAAAITRPTVYRYFSSRNEMLVGVFLSVLDERLDQGLETYFRSASDVDGFRDGVADACAFVLGVLRDDEVLQAIFHSSRLPAQDLLDESARLLVGALEVSLSRVVGWMVKQDVAFSLRPVEVEPLCAWIIRLLFAFLAWPGPTLEAEWRDFRAFLGPVIFTD